ncbi:MAG: hypothetical protein GF329_18120 [Candidatus Lokiarchaeota archaeon]|nr:hypothetical protein [Candidatus Lokiarchaeota archaeon]
MSGKKNQILKRSNTLHQHIEMNIREMKEKIRKISLKDLNLDEIKEEYTSFENNVDAFLSLLQNPEVEELGLDDKLDQTKLILDRLQNSHNKIIDENGSFDYNKKQFLNILEEILTVIRELNAIVTENFL